MQDQKLRQTYVFLAVPAELLVQAGIFEGVPLTMHTEEGRLIIEQDDDAFLCDGDCENCAMSDVDCDGECEECPCRDNCDESEVK